MGPDSANDKPLYFASEKYGEYSFVSPDITPFLESECNDEEAFQRALSIHSTSTFSCKLHVLGKCGVKLSGKRFKKILMSRGMSRDDAYFLCYVTGYHKGKVSYHDIYSHVLFLSGGAHFYEIFNYIMIKGEMKS